MRVSSYIKLLVVFCALGAGAGAGDAFGEFMQHKRDFSDVKRLAVDHNCGAYNEKTGEFGWVKPVLAQDVIEQALPGVVLSTNPPSIYLPNSAIQALHPTPKRKPEHRL